MLDDNALRTRPASRGGEVQVWRMALDRTAEEVAALFEVLSTDERERAARYVSERDRARFVAGRGLLRRVLAGYRGSEAPERLRFAYGAHGKPRLAAVDAEGVDVRFNLAHSDGLALLAVALGREVGVDVEWVREDGAIAAVADRYFSRAERDALAALPEGERCRAFYACWTRKEAYVKARGEGLALPLDGFTVSSAPGEAPALLAVEGEPGEPARWTLRDVEAGEGYAAAVAVEGRLAGVCYTAAI